MSALDRDLLIFEPSLFRDVSWTGQRLVRSTSASIDASGNILTLPGAGLIARNITAGHIALIDETPFEILQRLDDQTLQISRIRPARTDDPIPTSPGAALTAVITTFAPQLRAAHDIILRSIGIDPDAEPDAPPPTPAHITNPEALTRLQALGALHLIFAAASSIADERAPTNARAMLYLARYRAEHARTIVRLDLDGDGIPDAARRLSTIHLLRN